jgi:hypothetical protein
MTTGDVTLEVLRSGRVAVIESASETAHYPQLNRSVYSALDLPWLELEYVDESNLAALLDGPLEQRYAALVFTPGAIALPGVRALLEQRTAALAQALAHGVGLVITATTLGGLDRFDLAFLPEGSQVSLVDTGMREMTGTLRTDSLPDDVIRPDDGRRGCSALTLAAGHALGWTHTATLHRPDGQRETVAWRAQFGLGRVVVSVLPFEWIHRAAMVELTLTRVTRNRGILIIGNDPVPPWYHDLVPGQFLARIPKTAPAAADLLTKFSHLRLCTDTDWTTLDGLDRPALLARLENNGTVELPTDGPAGTIYARLDGVPRYLTRLRDAQAQLIDRIADLPASPTFHLLALALLSQAAQRVVSGRLYIPDLLRQDAVSSVVTSAMTRRVRNGSVDGLLLPTANLLAACTLCDIDDSAAVTMTAWITMTAKQATADQRAQARWALWAAGRRDLLDTIPEPELEPDSLLGRLACQLDDGGLEPLDPPPPDTSARRRDGGQFSDLNRAILAYTHARWGDPSDPQPIWDLLGTARPPDPDDGTVPINVEELCYRTAAQILLDAHTPLTIHPRHVPTAPVSAAPHATTELLTQQAAAELGERHERQARETLATVTRTARIMAGLLGLLAIALGLLATSLPFWLPAARHLDVEVRLTLAAATFLVVSTALTVTMAGDTAQLVAPRWLRALGKLLRHFRK